MIKIDELIPLINEAFNNNKTFTMPIKGTSMQPLWHTGSLVELDKISSVKPRDILFYQREDGSYVLHRLWKIKNGKYYMIGDHQLILETINPNQCFAKVIAYHTKKGKKKNMNNFTYKLYCFSLRFWFIRRVYIKCLH